MGAREQEKSLLPEPVISWRAARLRTAGFAPELARTLSSDRRCDVHAILDLIDRGCPPELAARILAPVAAESSMS